MLTKPLLFEHIEHCVAIIALDLQYRAEFFAEQYRQRSALSPSSAQFDIETAMTRERHFTQRCEQAAIGAIVIRENFLLFEQLLHGGEKSAQPFRLIDIGRDIADLIEHLRETRAAQTIFARAEIDNTLNRYHHDRYAIAASRFCAHRARAQTRR